jgi:hypothetical protein
MERIFLGDPACCPRQAPHTPSYEDGHNQMNEEEVLNQIISCCLFEPSGDPMDEHCRAATLAYKLLKDKGLTIKDDPDVTNILSGENIYEEDFLNS